MARFDLAAFDRKVPPAGPAARKGVRGRGAQARMWAVALSLCPAVALGTPRDTVLIRHFSLVDKKLAVRTDGPTEILLPDSFVVVGSVRIESGGETVPDSCFRVDYSSSRVILLCPPREAELLVRYKALPLLLPRGLRGLDYVSYQPEVPVGVRTRDAPSSARRLWEPAPGLRQSGTLVRGLTIGSNQSLSLQSGLRMQLSGRLADKVEVLASLSDKDTPIQPQGNTQTLREIDNVFVEIRAPSLKAMLGDFALSFPGGQFDRLDRRLEGGQVELAAGRAEVTFAGASSRGKFMTNRFLGREGVQGPYQLQGEGGRTEILVIAGSERVWVDGELMTRGEDRDYVIDYSTAQITFTRRRLITDESRIVVDFQYSDEKYPRSLYAGRIQYKDNGGRLQLRSTFVRESDDAKNPIGISLSPARTALLAAAGDSAALASEEGSRYVGAGKGSYVRRDSIFEYVGPGKGDYDVVFSDVGQGKGDYAYRGVGHFAYVGKGMGKYLPVVRIPLPARQEQLSLYASLQPWQAAALETELALSRFDRNVVSPRDDDDNLGAAGLVRLRLGSDSLRWGKARWVTQLRQVGARFREVHRTEEAEYWRRWDLPDNANRAESVLESSAALEMRSGLSSSLGLGRIRKPGFSADRREWTFGFQRPRLPSASFREEWIASQPGTSKDSGRWVRRKGTVNWSLNRWTPSLEYESERKTQGHPDSFSTAFAFMKTRAGIRYNDPAGFSAGFAGEYRTDDRLNGGALRRYSEAKGAQLEFTWRKSETLSANLNLIHRERRYRWGPETNTITDLLDLETLTRAFRGGFSLSLNYQADKEQVAKQERVFLRVEEGMGNYRFDPVYREYVPDPFGDYVLRFVPTEEFVPVTNLRAGASVQLDFSRTLGRDSRMRTGRALRDVSAEAVLRLEEQTRYPHPAEIYLLRWSRFQDPRYTLLGSLHRQADVYYRRGRRDGSLRLRWNRKTSLVNTYAEGGQRSISQLASALVLFSPWPSLGAEVELEKRFDERRYLGPGVDREVTQRRLRVLTSYRWNPLVETGIAATVGLAEDRAMRPSTQVRFLMIEPRLSLSFRRRGRVLCETRWANLSSEPTSRALPYEVAEGLQPGRSVSARLSAEYSLGKGMTASLQYLARSDPFRPRLVQRLQLEVRAYF